MSTTTFSPVGSGAEAAPIRPLEAIAAFFAAIANGQRAAAEFRRLNGQSDAALASRGLTRADVPRILRDRFFA